MKFRVITPKTTCQSSTFSTSTPANTAVANGQQQTGLFEASTRPSAPAFSLSTNMPTFGVAPCTMESEAATTKPAFNLSTTNSSYSFGSTPSFGLTTNPSNPYVQQSEVAAVKTSASTGFGLPTLPTYQVPETQASADFSFGTTPRISSTFSLGSTTEAASSGFSLAAVKTSTSTSFGLPTLPTYQVPETQTSASFSFGTPRISSTFSLGSTTLASTEFSLGSTTEPATSGLSLAAVKTSASTSFNLPTLPTYQVPETQKSTGFSLGSATQASSGFSLGSLTQPSSGFSLDTQANPTTATATTTTTTTTGFTLGSTIQASSGFFSGGTTQASAGFSLGGASQAPTGFLLGSSETTTAQTTTPQSTGVITSEVLPVTTQPDSQSSPLQPTNFHQLIDLINTFTVSLENQEKQFLNQANELTVWDNMLINQSNELIKLHDMVERKEKEQVDIEIQLDLLLSQQKELEECLVPLEQELQSAKMISNLNNEREPIYKVAQEIDSQVKEMAGDIKEIVNNLNKPNSKKDSDNDLDIICTVLNSHMIALENIEHNSKNLSAKIAEVNEEHSRFVTANDNYLMSSFKK